MDSALVAAETCNQFSRLYKSLETTKIDALQGLDELSGEELIPTRCQSKLWLLYSLPLLRHLVLPSSVPGAEVVAWKSAL